MKAGLLHLVRGLWPPRRPSEALHPAAAWHLDGDVRGTDTRPAYAADFAETQPLVFEHAHRAPEPTPAALWLKAGRAEHRSAGWREAPAP
jgi:hypothetical protein